MDQVVSASLAQERWDVISFEKVIHAFLESEWSYYPEDVRRQFGPLIFHPNLDSARENQVRRGLLLYRREPLLAKVPRDTVWYSVKCLRPAYLPQLRVINHSSWRSESDQNELDRVAHRADDVLSTSPKSWPPAVLWGHGVEGPFTILEGNHRLTALAAASQDVDFELEVYVGLSTSRCRWHLPDQLDQSAAQVAGD
jgi:hypothetical protein